jgi:Flp pilus assembly protein TadG
MQVFQRVGQAMYENQQAQAASEPAGDAGAADAGQTQAESDDDDDVVEGEIVDEGGS